MRRPALLFLGTAFLAGCAVGPHYRPPEPALPGAFLSGQEFASTNAVSFGWSAAFEDPLLARILDRAATNNHDVRIADARLKEARALWKESRFDFAPTVTSENRYENYRQSEDAAAPNRGRNNELYRAGFDATWELDLWGKVRRSVEAARATVESVQASGQDILVSIQAEAAANYIELRGLQAQLGVATRNAENQAQILRLAEALLEGGSGTRLDVARARSLLNATRASIPPLEGAVRRTIHRISVLCGQPPAALLDELTPPGSIPAGPFVLALESPAVLIRRRPDVRAAERSLAAATARIGIQVADLFPRITFVGTVGLQAGSFSGLSESGSDTFGFGPHLSWAAFDLGRVRQQIRAADARAEAALAIYEQTVLLALEEAENSLATFGRERQRLGFLKEAERAATEATELARQRYRDGIADFLSVLDAERTLLDLQEQLALSETRSATSLVSVYKAFAAGAR